MADNNENDNYEPEEPFNLGPIVAPLATSGHDPAAVRANPALFAKLTGGGIGMASDDNPARPSSVTSPAPSGSVPASASRTGRATPDMAQTALKNAMDAMSSAPDANAELAKEQAAEDDLRKQKAILASGGRETDPNSPNYGKLKPEDRPSVGRRFIRGLEGFAHGGIRGVLNADYGAPNQRGQQDLRNASAAVDADTQSLSELRNRFKEAQEAAYGRARENAAIGTLAKDLQEKPDKEPTTVDSFAIQTAKQLFPDDPAAQQKYVDEHSAAANKPDKTPTTYEQTVIAAENEKDPNGPYHRAAQKMVDTEKKKFAAANPGRQPTDLELWRQAFKSQYHREPNSEEIASRHVSGGGLAGEAAGKPGKAVDRTAFDAKWNNQFNVMERKYDARKNAVNKNTDLSDDERAAQIQQIEAERAAEKLGIQTEKDKAAEASGVYNQPAAPARPAAPAATTPSGAPQNAPQNKPAQPKPLTDPNVARQYLQKAGGDKNKARQMAKRDGYTF